MTEATDGIFNFTSPHVMAHPAVIEAKKFKRKGVETGDPKFSLSIVLDPEHADFKAVKAKAIAIAKAKWPDADLKTIKFPFTGGDKLADKYVEKRKAAGKDDDGRGDFQRGKVVLKTSSKFRPRLSILENGKIVDLEDEALIKKHAGKFFFGAECLYQVNVVAYDAIKEGDPNGVTAYINMVLATGKGKRLSGGASASEVFKGYAGAVSAENPVGDELDDEIPF